MVVTMDRTPPRRHAVDKPAAIREMQIHTMGGIDMVHRQMTMHGTIGMPDVRVIKVKLGFELAIGHGFLYAANRVLVSS